MKQNCPGTVNSDSGKVNSVSGNSSTQLQISGEFNVCSVSEVSYDNWRVALLDFI